MKKTPARIADAIDLTIDFATLGEYGLEPVTARDLPTGAGVASGHPKTPLWPSYATEAPARVGSAPIRRNMRDSHYDERVKARALADRRNRVTVELGATPISLRLPRINRTAA